MPDVFDSIFTYAADGFIKLRFRGVRGEHGHVSPTQTVSAWRLDVLMEAVNLTTVFSRFKNGTERATSFYTAGSPDWLSTPSRRSAAASLQAGPFAPAANESATGGVFVGGCSPGSSDALGLIGVDLAWVVDPAYGVAFVGMEEVDNVTTQHWRSPKCRDIWIRTWAGDDGAEHAAPVRVQVQAMSGVINFGCVPPVQVADYEAFAPLPEAQAGTGAPLFQPPAQCAPPSGNDPDEPPSSSSSLPPWAWGVGGGLACLVLGALVGYFVASCHRNGDADEPRERFSSHLLDVL